MSDMGKGRFPRSRRVAILQRYDGTAWAEVGRYGSVRDADEALDQAIATGVDPESLRVTEAARTASTVALMVLGAIAFAVVLAFALYVWFAA